MHSDPGAVVLDYFAGSGTTGEAAARAGRGFVLVDRSREAVEIMAARLAGYAPELSAVGATSLGASGATAAAMTAAERDPCDRQEMSVGELGKAAGQARSSPDSWRLTWRIGACARLCLATLCQIAPTVGASSGWDDEN